VIDDKGNDFFADVMRPRDSSKGKALPTAP